MTYPETHPAKVARFIWPNFLAFHFDMQLQMASLKEFDQRVLYVPFKLHQKVK